MEFSHFSYDPTDVGNLIPGSSAFFKSSLNIWKFLVHVLLKPCLENFEHCFVTVWSIKQETSKEGGGPNVKPQASTRLSLIKWYNFAEPHFLYLLNGNNYGVGLIRLPLMLDEAINAKCLMLLSTYMVLNWSKVRNSLGCLVTKCAWKQILNTVKRRESGERKWHKELSYLVFWVWYWS